MSSHKEQEIQRMKDRHAKEIAEMERAHRLESGEPTYEDLVWQVAQLKTEVQRANERAYQAGEA